MQETFFFFKFLNSEVFISRCDKVERSVLCSSAFRPGHFVWSNCQRYSNIVKRTLCFIFYFLLETYARYYVFSTQFDIFLRCVRRCVAWCCREYGHRTLYYKSSSSAPYLCRMICDPTLSLQMFSTFSSVKCFFPFLNVVFFFKKIYVLYPNYLHFNHVFHYWIFCCFFIQEHFFAQDFYHVFWWRFTNVFNEILQNIFLKFSSNVMPGRHLLSFDSDSWDIYFETPGKYKYIDIYL